MYHLGTSAKWQIYYQIAGSGSPIMLLHGFGRSGYTWQRSIPYLVKHGQLIVVDLPGHGRSKLFEKWQLSEVAFQLGRSLQRMAASPLTLIGHSMGGAIAISLAVYMPQLVERLILVDSIGVPLQISLPTLARRAMLSSLQYPSGVSPWILIRDILQISPSLLWQTAQEVAKSDFSAELASITIPTLIIWGENDRLFPVFLGQALSEMVPRSIFITFSDCGHCPHFTKPEKFSWVVGEFLQHI